MQSILGRLLLSRSWLPLIAADFGNELGIIDPQAAKVSAQEALEILSLAPWHFIILVGTVELCASLLCLSYRVLRLGFYTPTRELALFTRVPFISAPLLRLYRSLVAVSWFECESIAAHLGSEETLDVRQERFRELRRAL